MQDNSNPSPSGSIIEPTAAQPFAPAAPGATPYNTGAPLMSNGAAALPVEPAKKSSHTLIETALLVIVSIVAVVFVWLFVQTYIQKDSLSRNFDSMVNAEVAQKVAENTTKLEEEFAEREKFPYKNFLGPADYGSLGFQYPRTWSVYIAKDAANGGDFEAYLNPVEVNPVSNSSINALRVKIRDASFDTVIRSYESQIKNGKLTLKNDTVGGVLANIYTGEISNDIHGAVMVLKLRDKTVLLQTDAEIFMDDFYRILESVTLIE